MKMKRTICSLMEMMVGLGLELNVEKTVFLVVRKRRAGYHSPCRLELNRKRVMSSRVIKHLGVMLDGIPRIFTEESMDNYA